MRIAILDNNLDQIELMRQVLTLADHACDVLQSPAQVLESEHANDFDLLIMDEDAVISGTEFLHGLRKGRGAPVPALLLTTRSKDAAILTLLEAGMTDYMVKPIRRRELAFRVRVLLSRAYPGREATALVQFGAYGFDANAARVTSNGIVIDVTRKEFELALLFFRNLGRPLSRAFIREAIWPREPELMSRTMDTHVSRVRRKLGLLPENGFRLAPVYSYGYRLEQVHS